MPARITKLQKVVPIRIIGATFCIQDEAGYIHNGKIDGAPRDLSIEEPKTVRYYGEDILAKVEYDNGEVLALLYNLTWMLVRESDGLLLDIGTFTFDDVDVFKTPYEHVGYIQIDGYVYPAVLDMNNKLLVHAMSADNKPLGVTYKLEKPLTGKFDIREAERWAHIIKQYEGLYVVDEDGNPVKGAIL